MKIVLVDVDYRDDLTFVSVAGEPFEATQEEYDLIRKFFTVRIVMDKEYLLEEATKRQKELEALLAKRREDEQKRKLAAQKAAEKRKQKQLEKLKKELGVE